MELELMDKAHIEVFHTVYPTQRSCLDFVVDALLDVRAHVPLIPAHAMRSSFALISCIIHSFRGRCDLALFSMLPEIPKDVFFCPQPLPLYRCI